MPDFYAVEVKTVDRHRVCFSQISNLFTGFFTEFAGISQQESHSRNLTAGISQKGIPKMEGRRKGWDARRRVKSKPQQPVGCEDLCGGIQTLKRRA